MNTRAVPHYAVFDDHRIGQRITVTVRWFLLGVWLFLINYRTDLTINSRLLLDSMGAFVAILNACLHWRIVKERFISRRFVVALSLMDLAVITGGIAATTGFQNTFFVFYYPALLALPLALSSRLYSLMVVALVAATYTLISVYMTPSLVPAAGEDRILVVRIATMVAVVWIAQLTMELERKRRREAVEAERRQWQKSMGLQERAQRAELAAREERSRKTCADLAARQAKGLTRRLEQMVGLSKQTLLDVRHYIFDLKPYLAGEKSVIDMLENQAREFSKASGISTTLDTSGEPRSVPASVATNLYRVAQEALSNALKYSRASRVEITLKFLPSELQLIVKDNGRGFDSETAIPGYGLSNMRERAEEVGGQFNVLTARDSGTEVVFSSPTDIEGLPPPQKNGR
jgi:signal transduction histidine kinase